MNQIQISVESKLDINSETYSESFKTHLLDVVYGWACKKSFAEILYISETYEGNSFVLVLITKITT